LAQLAERCLFCWGNGVVGFGFIFWRSLPRTAAAVSSKEFGVSLGVGGAMAAAQLSAMD